MVMLTNLASILRGVGVPVVEVKGWTGRGHGAMTSASSVVLHHTAGAATGNFPSLNVVTNGRSDLPGPLCNLGLGRDGTWYVVAAGLAYHAGAVFDSTYANVRAIGIEMENTGTGQAWPEAQLSSMARGVAALCKAYGIPVDRVKGHKEICSPAGRKIDPAGIPGDMAAARARVSAALDSPAPVPAPAVSTNNDEESTMLVPAGTNEHVVLPTAGRPQYWYAYTGFGRKVTFHTIAYVMATPAGTGADFAPGGYESGNNTTGNVFDANRPGPVAIPTKDGKQPAGIVLRYTADHAFTLYCG